MFSIRKGLNSIMKYGYDGFCFFEDKKLIHLSMSNILNSRFQPTVVKVSKGIEYKWCSCGKTKAQPFCDGCPQCGNKPLTFKALENKEYAFCNCKESKNKPFCDGTHAKI